MSVNSALLACATKAIRSAAAVCPHNDADGLAAGAIALRARGEAAGKALLLPRGMNPFSDDFAPPKGVVAVLDQGVRPTPYSCVIVDHHAPESRPGENQIVFSGFGEANVSTSVLMRRLFPDAPAWLAAVGAAGDYGDAGLKLPECAGVVKSHVKKLVPLVNAPRRLPDDDGGRDAVRTALALLVECESPKAALADERIEVLEDARRQWRAAFDAVVRTPPRVAGDVALVRFRSPCQVHPLVAQTWMTRLAPKIVIAANDDYLPGHTNFAARGGPPEADLRQFLRAALPDATGEFAHGHPKATGGSLPTKQFDALVRALGLS